MGLFDFLSGCDRKRTNVEVVPDHIWMTTAARIAGLTRAARDRSRPEAVAILLVALKPGILKAHKQLDANHFWLG